MFLLWIFSIIITLIIAHSKGLNKILYFILSIFFGPIALFICLIDTPRAKNNDILPVKPVSINEVGDEITRLKNDLYSIQSRLNSIEERIGEVKNSQELKHHDEGKSIKEEAPSPLVQAADGKEKNKNMELDLGRYWLNKIGIVIFTLGIGFLITYSFKYFGPVLKILTGYCVSVILFFLGLKLAIKEKFSHLGKVLQAGGWAMTYFTTYSMYHFDTSRIINNQFVDAALLTVVVIGMFIHSLKYKSETITAMIFLIGYLTATIGNISVFTFVSCILLSIFILLLVYKFNWIRLLVFGVLANYAIHYFWIMPNSLFYSDVLNLYFLTSYWLVYTVGTHVLKSEDDKSQINKLAAINIGNLSLYFLMSYPIITRIFSLKKFEFVLVLGLIYLSLALIMNKLNKEKMFRSDIVAGIMALTFSIPLKFHAETSLLIWFVEIPFLLFCGLSFKNYIFRYLSYVLTAAAFFWMIFIFLTKNYLNDLIAFGFLNYFEFLLFMSGISMAVSYFFWRTLNGNKSCNSTENNADHLFTVLSFLSFSFMLGSMVSDLPIMARSFAFSVFSLIIFYKGIFLALKRLRIYSYLLLIVVIELNLFSYKREHVINSFIDFLFLVLTVLSFYVVYLSLKFIFRKRLEKTSQILPFEMTAPFIGGAIIIFYYIFEYMPSQWISVALGLCGALLFALGFILNDKTSRIGGLLFFLTTVLNIILNDLSGLSIIYKIISFIVLGVLFIGVSYFYNKNYV